MVYIEARNTEASCRYHPGEKRIDTNWNSLWTCCKGGIASRGCRLGPHVATRDEDEGEDPDATPAVS